MMINTPMMANVAVIPGEQCPDNPAPGNGIAALCEPWVQSELFEAELAARNLAPKQAEMARFYHEHGYLHITESIVDDLLAEQINKDVFDHIDNVDKRLQDAWRFSDAVRELACNDLVISILRILYGREPIPFQTLNFIRGTEQQTHSDAIHFNTLPRGYLCGVWVALEDVTAEQGPLHYYPRSHVLPEFDYYDLGIAEEFLWPTNPHTGEPNFANPRTLQKLKLYEEMIARIVADRGLERKALVIKRGEFLIWSANLFHGGNPIIKAGSTRKSQVTHFHFDGVIPWSPQWSNAAIGEYHIPDLVDVRNSRPLERSYNGLPIILTPTGIQHRHRISIFATQTAYEEAMGNMGQTDSSRTFVEQLRTARGEAEYLAAEVARLQEQVRNMSDSAVWKISQPLRDFVKAVKNQ